MSILLNLPVPLKAIQLLWLNLVTDSFPALALGTEKGEPDIMDIPPRGPDEPILNGTMLKKIGYQSIAIATASLLAFKWGLNQYPGDISKARTITFVTLITAELLRAYSSRSQKHSLFKIGFFTNKNLVYSTLFSFTLMLAVVYIPLLQPIFETFALGLGDWKIILPYAFIPLVVGELDKIIFKGR